MIDVPFRSKETSWLAFNSRVLQEAADPTVPLMERIKFLGIYSSNLDEFFRVRVATLRRLVKLNIPTNRLGIPNPAETLSEVMAILRKETRLFNQVYDQVFAEMEIQKVRLIRETEVPQNLVEYLEHFFDSQVLPRIMPIVIKANSELGGLKDRPMYLAVRMNRTGGRTAHSLIEMPSELDRFHLLPKRKETDSQLVMYLDDVIRFGLKKVFECTPYDSFESYALKITRDAEIEFDDDITESYYEKMSEALRARDGGLPVRVNYDEAMPAKFLRLVLAGLDINEDDDWQFPGARYHNRKDLMSFPKMGMKELCYAPVKPVLPSRLRQDRAKGIFRAIRVHDVLLHFPYHSFNHFLDLLREATIDPLVKSIKVTQYRLASRSCVSRALISAVKNGKEVTVVVEPQARFDEEANITWASKYQAAGVKVILGVPGLKVHAKLCLIERLEHGHLRYYTCVGTGNFNEQTASYYTDHMLMTYDQEIGEDVDQIFRFCQRNYQRPVLKHLFCAPFNLREKLFEAIDNEIAAAKEGNPAEICVKINNISDVDTVKKFYEASQAGVKIRMIVRSMFSVITDASGYSDNIEAIGIVDQLLEHTRLLIFHNGGDKRFYMSSADFLQRNFDSRCETMCPVYDKTARQELEKYFEIQWQDTVKARDLDQKLKNEVRANPEGPDVRAQTEIGEFIRHLSARREKVRDPD